MTDPTLHRRDFLGLLGSVPLGRLLMPRGTSPLGDEGQREQRQAAVRSSVLLSRSLIAPGAIMDFRHGLETALDGLLDAARPEIETLGVGGGEAAETASRLSRIHRIPLIAGAFDARRAAEVERAVAGQAVIVDVGAGALLASAPAPQRQHLQWTQGLWQSASALGLWSGARHQRVVIVSSLYDAGYDALYAFRLGLEQSGGTVVETIITDVPHRILSPNEVVRQVLAHDPDAVFVALHDHQGPLFLRAWMASPAAQHCELLGTSLLGAAIRDTAGARMHWVSTYDPALANPVNQRFVAAFQARTGRLPDAWAVGGWEVGMLVARLRAGSNQEQIEEQLLQLVLDSPRGRIHCDPALRSAYAPHYLVCATAGDQQVQHEVMQVVDPIAEDDQRVLAWQSSLRTGWSNPYLSV